MKVYYKFIDSTGREGIGSTSSGFVELKTMKGCVNRVKKYMSHANHDMLAATGKGRWLSYKIEVVNN